MKTKPTYKELENEVKELREKLSRTKSEDYFTELMKNNTNAFAVIDIHSNSVFQSETYASILGYTPKERIGKNAFELIHPDDRNKLMQVMKVGIKKHGISKKISFRAYHKNGSIKYLEGTAKNMLHSPIINGIIINYRDVTERETQEQALKQRENYLTALNKATLILQDGELKNQIQKFTETIGKVAHASRTYIFKNHKDKNDKLLLSQIAEYAAPGINAEIDNPLLQHLSYADWLPRWEKILSEGNIVNGKLANFLQTEKEILQPQNIKAILIIPIMIGKEFWGFIGFDNCINDNEWQKTEIEFLKAAAQKISHNIEKQREQNKLESENKRFIATMDSIDAVVYVADMQTHELLFLNKYGIKFWGNKVGEKCYKALQGLEKACSFCTNNKLLDKNGKPNEPYIWEFQNTITKQWYQCRDQAIQWTNGRLVRLEIATDITERKKAEFALKASEEEFRLLYENSPDLIAIHNKTDILHINKSGLKLIGATTPDEIVGKFIVDFIYPDDREMSLVNMKKLFSGEESKIVIEQRIVRLDGKVIDVEVIGVPISYGKEPMIQIIVRDITERKKAEQELIKTKEKAEENEDRLKTFINTIPDIVCYKDGKGRWLMANKADLELFCLTDVDYYGKTDNELAEYTDKIYKEAFSTCIVNDEIAWKNKKTVHNIENIPTISGETKSYDVFKIPTFYPDGTRKALAVIGRDITELIKAKEKAQESDRLKSAFLANMSHEIRTPMNAILGFGSFLKNPKLSPKKRNYFVDIINHSGNHLLNLINDIVDISKIDAKQMTVIETECKLNEFLFEIYQFFHSTANSKEKQLELSLKKSLPDGFDVIKTDTTRLRQILINLIGNAVKFTKEGSIEIKYLINENNELEFSVKDSGIGISEKELPIIFKRFRQADETLTKKYGGTGLGLAISKACVELLGGKIRVKSEHGKGSTFSFTIPYKPVNKPTIEKETVPVNTDNIFAGKTILIVEDEPYSCLILEEILKPTGAIIEKVTNGKQAIDLCKKKPEIDIVLMDVQLPYIDGLSATKEILKFRPNLPIISQTANAMQNDREKSIQAGCVDYITKPINKTKLQVIIQKYLRK